MGGKGKPGSKALLSHLVNANTAQDYFTASGIFMLVINPEGIIEFANSKACEILGCKAKELIGYHWADKFIPSIARDELIAHFNRLLGSESYENVHHESSFVNVKGEEKTAAWSDTLIRDKQGNIVNVILSGMDITAHEQVKEKLARYETEYEHLVEGAGIGIISIDLEGQFTFVNDTFCSLVGYPSEKLLTMKFPKVIYPPDNDKAYQMLEELLANPKNKPHVEIRLIRKNGNIRWVSANPTTLMAGNKVVGISSTIVDIDEKRKALEALKQSELKYSTLVESSSDIIIISQDGLLKYTNAQIFNSLGYRPEELIGKSSVKPIAPADRDMVRERLAKRMAGEDVPSKYEARFMAKDGHEILAEVNASVIDYEGKPAAMAIIRDITERKQAEEALKQSEIKYSTLVEGSSDIIIIAQDGLLKYANAQIINLLGYQPEELVGKPAVEAVAPADKDMVRETLQKRMTGKDVPSRYEARLRTKDGHEVLAEISAGIIDYEGKPAVMAILHDITERKHTEDTVRQSELKYATLVESSYDFITIVQDGLIKFINNRALDSLGYSRDELLGNSFIPAVAPADQNKLMDVYQRTMAGEEVAIGHEVTFVAKDGREVLGEIRAALIDYEGRPAVMGIARDITKRKKAEDALKQSELKYSTLVESSNDFIIITQDGLLRFTNTQVFNALGYQPKELIGKPIELLFAPSDRDLISSRYRMRAEGEDVPDRYEASFLTKDGREIPTELSAKVIEYEGRPAVMAVMRDITERKQAEEILRQSELKYSTLVEKSNDMILILQDEVFKFANAQILNSLGYRPEEVINKPVTNLYAPSDRDMIHSRYQRRIKGQYAPSKYEAKFLAKDGREIPTEVNGSVIEYEGRPAVMAVIRDITERKRAEEELKEREALLNMVGDIGMIGGWEMNLVNRTAKWTRTLYDIAEIGYDDPIPGPDEHIDYYLPQYRPMIQEAMNRLIENGENIVFEAEVQTAKGNIKWCRAIGHPIECINGRCFRIGGTVQDIADRKKAEEELTRSYATLKKTLGDAINTMAKIVEMRDPYTAGHQQRVTRLAVAIARELGMDEPTIENLTMSAVIHDIGKIYEPSDILNTPGKLNELEFQIIQNHPQGGFDIVKSMDFPCSVARTILEHHERSNGSGYPNGLKDKDISIEGKILAVADVVEAMATHRPYRPALGIDKALDEISSNRGALYDPNVVDACLRVFKDGNFNFEANPENPQT